MMQRQQLQRQEPLKHYMIPRASTTRGRARSNIKLGQLLDSEGSSKRILVEPTTTATTTMKSGSSKKILLEPATVTAMMESSKGANRRGLHRAGGLRRSLLRKSGCNSTPSEESMRSLGMSARLDLYEQQLSLRRSMYSGMEDSVASFWYEDDDANTDAMLEVACAKLSLGATEPVQEERTSLEELAKQAEEQGPIINSDADNDADNNNCYKEEEQYEMEIAPGYYVAFRGAKEVWQAVANGTTLECCCMECGTELVSVADCEHVVCPDECCRMVNPVFDRPAFVTTTPFGAGMGLKKEWVNAAQQNGSSSRGAPQQRASFASSA